MRTEHQSILQGLAAVVHRSRGGPGRRQRPAAIPTLEPLEGRTTPTTLLPGFTATTIATGLNPGTAMEFSPDGRLFVLEQTGNVELVHSDGTTWTALHLSVDSQIERGLLGIAFDPDYSANHYVYLYYTNPNPGAAPWATGEHNQLSRFTVNDSNPQQPVFTNEAPILDWNNLSSAGNHNGGAIHFGGDGMLYADAGDNVQTFTLNGNTYRVSQTLASLLGKQLRINVSAFNSGLATRDDTAVGHLIPADNPFVGTATGINQLIYNLGLRNPYTFAVQPGTGTIYINDVGENTWEEIDQSIAGANYGWSGGNTDGFGQTPPGPGVYHDPLLAYNHNGGPAGGGNGIVGGTFYDPAAPTFPSTYVGKYFYADLGAGWIRVFDPSMPGTAANPDTSTAFASGIAGTLVDLAVDPAGNLDYLTNSGVVGQISYTPNQVPPGTAPTITSQPQGQVLNLGQPVTFTVAATGSAPIDYQWQHLVRTTWVNVGADAPAYVIGAVTAADAGDYRVVVSNADGVATSNTASLAINVPNTAPTIVTQPVSTQVSAGQPATFTVTAVGSAPLTYQWQHLVGALWQNVGPSSATFTIAATAASDAGSYRVFVSNAEGSVFSNNVALTISTPSGPAPPVVLTPGLEAEFFDFTKRLGILPNLRRRLADVTRTDADIAYAPTGTLWPGLDARFATTYASLHTGYLQVGTPGRYTLALSSSDGSKLWLDGKLLINNDGLHQLRTRTRTLRLSAGFHALRVEYFDNKGNASLILSWSGPGIARQVIPASQLFQGAVV